MLNKNSVFAYLGRVPRPIITFKKSGVLQFEGGTMLADLEVAGEFGAKRICKIPEKADYVRVMSLHKSKGLTSKVTIVSGCVQGLIHL